MVLKIICLKYVNNTTGDNHMHHKILPSETKKNTGAYQLLEEIDNLIFTSTLDRDGDNYSCKLLLLVDQNSGELKSVRHTLDGKDQDAVVVIHLSCDGEFKLNSLSIVQTPLHLGTTKKPSEAAKKTIKLLIKTANQILKNRQTKK